MVKKKDLVIVALATFCLTATLFMIVSTRSQTGQYDPWMDLDDNGQINILDAIDLSNVYGTSGDPTKIVTVTNLPEHDTIKQMNVRFYWSEHMGIILSSTDPNTVDCRGFSKMYVYAHATNVTWYPINATFPVSLSWVQWTVNDTDPYYEGDYRPENVAGHLNMTVQVWQTVGYQNETQLNTWPVYSDTTPSTATIDVKGPWCKLFFSVPYYPYITWDGWMDLAVTVYLRNE
jgi:hypothetical protein